MSTLTRRTVLAMLTAVPALAMARVGSIPPNVKIIIPWPPGSGGDIAGRLVAQRLADELGVNVFVENRGGASGSIGSAAGSRDKADGSVLILGNSASHGSASAVIPNLSYDPVEDFTPISMLYRNTLALAVSRTFPANSLTELIEFARKNPGKLSFGTPGVGTPHQLVGELIKERAGVDMVHVPYKGSGQIMTDLAGDHIQIAISAQAAALEMHRSGTIRVLAVADEGRSVQLPDVPAIAETLPGFDVAGWGGLFGPAGMPADITRRYEQAIQKIMTTPEFMKVMEGSGFVPVFSTGDALRSLVQDESDRWKVIVGSGGKS